MLLTLAGGGLDEVDSPPAARSPDATRFDPPPRPRPGESPGTEAARPGLGNFWEILLEFVEDQGFLGPIDEARLLPETGFPEDPRAERVLTRRSGNGRVASGSKSRGGGSRGALALAWQLRSPSGDGPNFGPVAMVSLFAVQGIADLCSKSCSRPRSTCSVWNAKPPPTLAASVLEVFRSSSRSISLSGSPAPF